MSVFDGNVKVGRAVPDPGSDKSLPQSGALSWGGIKSASGLAGTTGADCKVVHGDQFQMIEANKQTFVNSNCSHTTMGNNTCSVIQNRSLTTMANRNETVTGASVQTHVGAASQNYASNHVVMHSSPQSRFEPGVWMHYAFDYLMAGNSVKNIGMLYFQFYVNYTSITPTYLNLTPILNFALTGINIHFEGFDNGGRGMENKIAALEADIEGLQMEAELLELGTQVCIKSLSLAINSIMC